MLTTARQDTPMRQTVINTPVKDSEHLRTKRSRRLRCSSQRRRQRNSLMKPLDTFVHTDTVQMDGS